MQLPELKQQLSKGVIQPLYILTGPETGIMDIYIKKISDTANAPIKRVDELSSIYSKLQNNSIMSRPTCFVIRDDKDYLKQEKIWSSINSGKAQGKNIIILIYTNLDKRGKFYKAHSEGLTEFERLIPEVLAKHINKEIGLDIPNSISMAKRCDCDYSRAMLECDKLKRLSEAEGIDIERAWLKALQCKLIYTSPQDVIFDLIDSICRRDERKSFRLWEELKQINESPLGVISLLYNNIRSILLVQSAGSGDIANRTGLSGWQIKTAKEKSGHYSIPELVTALRTIRETEKGIKTGGIEQDMALDYILISLFRG